MKDETGHYPNGHTSPNGSSGNGASQNGHHFPDPLVTERIKKAIICKHITDYCIDQRLTAIRKPEFGDVAIFRVLEIGKHDAIQGDTGNNTYIFPGDTIMAAFGTRYATNQFEGYVPDQIREEYEILGKGGAIGVLESMHLKLQKVGPTRIQLLGFATDCDGRVLNTIYHHEERTKFNPKRERNYRVVLSIGSSMDSGKTTSAAFLCRGISLAGKRVAYVKITGTVYSRDRSFVRDCGAMASVDFSTLGYPSTYMCTIPEIIDIYEGLLKKVEEVNPEYVVVEIADGLLQQETFALLNHKSFISTISSVLFSAGDSIGAISGLQMLNSMGIYPFSVGGLFTTSPLLVKEVQSRVEIPILLLPDLSSPAILSHLEPVRKRATA